MQEQQEQSYQIANMAIGSLKAHGLSATPRNIEIWYAHLEGRNPALSRDIQASLGPDGKIDQPKADDLYARHILRTDMSRDVMDLVGRFELEVAKLSDLMEETGENTEGYSKRMTAVSKDIRKSAGENPAIASLLENVIAVTGAMRDANQKLEKQLAQSSDEVAYLRQSVESIQQEAMTDPLTGVRNRKVFDRSLERLMREARAKGESLSIIIADVDHFKKFNDRWGHQTGDQVLRLVAEVMDANVKGQDLLARYGGEEFAIILPETSLENGRMLADRIRRAVETRKLKKRRTNESLGVITLSMGVSMLTDDDTAESLIERADQCLYAAKDAGRNRVLAETDLPAARAKTSVA